MHNLLKSTVDSDNLLKDKEFIKLPEFLEPLEQPQMQAKKQWDLYEKVRPFVPEEYQDILSPQPSVNKD